MTTASSAEVLMPLGRKAERSPGTDRKYVTALGRGVDVLRCFGPRDGWLANQDIAARTHLAKPTITRLTYTLVRTGHLRYSRTANRYALGRAARALGFAHLAQMQVRCVARPLMEALSRQARGTVDLAVRDGPWMALVDSYQDPTRSVPVDIGARVPIAQTSIGRAYLFGLAPPDRRALLDELRQSDPSGWPRTKRGLDDAEADYDRTGFAMTVGGWRRDVITVAVPLLLADPPEPVVFSFSGAAFQLDPETMRDEIAPRLVMLAGNVRSALNRE